MRSYFVPVIAVAIIVPASLSARTGALDGDASIIPARDHKCPLSGVKRTSVLVMRISVPDPKADIIDDAVDAGSVAAGRGEAIPQGRTIHVACGVSATH